MKIFLFCLLTKFIILPNSLRVETVLHLFLVLYFQLSILLYRMISHLVMLHWHDDLYLVLYCLTPAFLLAEGHKICNVWFFLFYLWALKICAAYYDFWMTFKSLFFFIYFDSVLFFTGIYTLNFFFKNDDVLCRIFLRC